MRWLVFGRPQRKRRESLCYNQRQAAPKTLEPLLDDVADENVFLLRSDGTNWSMVVPKHAALAGNFLLTSGGRLRFHPNAAATEADVVLTDFSK